MHPCSACFHNFAILDFSVPALIALYSTSNGTWTFPVRVSLYPFTSPQARNFLLQIGQSLFFPEKGITLIDFWHLKISNPTKIRTKRIDKNNSICSTNSLHRSSNPFCYNFLVPDCFVALKDGVVSIFLVDVLLLSIQRVLSSCRLRCPITVLSRVLDFGICDSIDLC